MRCGTRIGRIKELWPAISRPVTKNIRVSGSLTVEAALVVPIILFVIAAIIVFSMWQRDIVMAKATVSEAVRMADADSAQEAEGWMLMGLSQTFTADVNGGLSMDGETANAHITSDISFDFFGLKVSSSYDISRKRLNQPGFLRKCTLLQEVLDG